MRLELPVIPLRNTVILPHTTTPVDVGRAKSKRAVEEAMGADRLIFLVAQRDPEVDDPTQDDLYVWGVQAVVKQAMRLPDGTLQVMVEARARAEVKDYIAGPFLRARGEVYSEVFPADETVTRVLVEELKDAFDKYVTSHKSLRLDRYQLEAVKGTTDPAMLADTITYHSTWTVAEKQEILELTDIEARLKKVLEFLSRDLERFELDKKVAQRVKDQMDSNQREYYLREQMKAIQKELGGGEDGLSDLDALRKKIEEIGMPEAVKTKALKELDRLERMQQGSPEATVARTYLDWLTEVPWTKADPEVLDIAHTRQILDEDHFGLKDVKERILEYLAVRQMTAHLEVRNKAPILVLVGPPGVGKTSLGRSIARSMNRKFHRISLGGVRDEAEIRGHRRTYIGAMPGRIIQGMRQAGSKNPVILLDEVDKLGASYQGDPAAALLELLDPAQNKEFTDHYLGVPFDMSEVLFICTANFPENIPGPLYDRMELIEFTSYIEQEKLEIAKRYLLPRQLSENGLKENQVVVTEAALMCLITHYTREAGVRNLEREIGTLLRKSARAILESGKKRVRITDNDLEKYLGPARFQPESEARTPQVGVATGMFYTPVGGDIMFIEVSVMPGKGNLILTGQLGDVMKESARAALSYAKKNAQRFGIALEKFDNSDVHIHVPAGAVPKEGPSAGIAITAALVSALAEVPVRNDVSMTGEITLTGRVLPIGGVKEKVLGARRAGIREVILPKQNQPDLSDIPAYLRQNLKFHFAETLDEVLDWTLVGGLAALERKNVSPTPKKARRSKVQPVARA